MKRLITLLFAAMLFVGCSDNKEVNTDPINHLPQMLGRDIDDVTSEFMSGGYAILGIILDGESEQRSCFSRVKGEIVLPIASEEGVVEKIATLFVIDTENSKHLSNVITNFDELLISSYDAKFTKSYVVIDGSELSYDSVENVIKAVSSVEFSAVESAGVTYSAIVEGVACTLEVPYFKAALYHTTGSPSSNFYSGIWFKL